MKDERLEKEFEEYFKGVNISDDIIADAKKSAKPKSRVMPKIVKFVSVAASIVLVFAVALTIVLKTDFKLGGNKGNSTGTPPSLGADSGFRLYSDRDLVKSDGDAYSVSTVNSSLKFIENLAYSQKANVESCKVGYMDGELALVTAQVSLLNGLNRDETVIFVEFTETELIYSGLEDYYDGETFSYYGAKYYLTSTTAENGEPEFKLHITYGKVKYYFKIQSVDRRAYEKYLKMVTHK